MILNNLNIFIYFYYIKKSIMFEEFNFNFNFLINKINT